MTDERPPTPPTDMGHYYQTHPEELHDTGRVYRPGCSPEERGRETMRWFFGDKEDKDERV